MLQSDPQQQEQQIPNKAIVAKTRLATLEETKPYSFDKYKHLLYDEKTRRFLGGNLLYQANMLRPQKSTSQACFTMHPQDMIHLEHETYYWSLPRIYMDIADITEYQVAQKLFGSIKLWRSFVTNVHVAEHIEELREELNLKLKSEALSSMRETMLTEGSKGTAAAKYINQLLQTFESAEKLQHDTSKSSSFSSSKRAVAGNIPSEEQLEDGFEADIARLQLVSTAIK